MGGAGRAGGAAGAGRAGGAAGAGRAGGAAGADAGGSGAASAAAASTTVPSLRTISANTASAHSRAALAYSQSSWYPIRPLLYSAKNARAAAILALRRRCTQSLWRTRPFPVVCPAYSSEANAMSRNSANASAMSSRDLPLATRMYAQEGDTARSACRRDGAASASMPSSAEAGPSGPPPSPSSPPGPRPPPPPRDPFISDSSRMCQRSRPMRRANPATARAHRLVLAKRALRMAVLRSAMPSRLASISAASASGMRLR